MHRSRVGHVVAIVVFALTLAHPTTALAQLASPAARPPAPHFTLNDEKGAAVTLAAYRGRVVVLDFWATWCAGCKVEIPWFMEFNQRYARQGLATIGVAMDEEGWDIVRPYLREHPITYPTVVSTPIVSNAYRAVNLPMTLLIDRHGRVAESHVGMVDKDQWEQKIQTLLGEPAAAAASVR